MSQRGFRRDNRQSYQMNASNYGRSGQNMNLNPWEGGMVPGGRGGVAGLLPTPPQASSLISQLSSPEAQLALASNLLSTLLRPQQQQSQVPSLLSLGALGQMGGGGPGGYRQQPNYGHNQGRYQDRQQKLRMNSRRPEGPYNKMGNRSRDSQGVQGHRSAPSKSGPERKPGAQGYRSPNVGKARPAKIAAKPDKKDDEADVSTDKANEVKKTEEESKREEGDDDEKKRDWKDEKKPEDGEIVDEDKEDAEKHGKGSRYSGIPNGLFFCHVCKKHMWDDHSFENHLKGRTHLLMMEKLEESYKIKVDLMRHELQVAEQQREIELERMKRQGKKIQMSSREYCTMCDLSFYGNIVMHRKTERHQQLKSFLHPRCLPCGKEFPTRVEWDVHKLTAVHLRKTAEARKNRKAGSDDEFGIEDFIASDNGERRDIKVRTREDEENDIIEMDKSKEKGGKDEENKDKEDGKEDAKGVPVVDPSGNLRYRVPKYNPDVAVGQSLLKKVTGQTCRACHRFFLHEEDAKTHCRTLSHYNNYIELVKTKARVMSQERREAKKNMAEDAKRPIDLDEDGNWKRRKVANENDEDEDGTEEMPLANATEKTTEGATVPGVNANEEPSSTSTTPAKLDPGQEKYDPLEADNEDSLAEGDDKLKTETTSETEAKPKAVGDIVDDDNLWEEVDRDIGNILETVEGEGVAVGETPADGGENESKADKGEDEDEEEDEEEESSKPATRTRGSSGSTRGVASPSPRGGRGRKKK